MHISSLHRSAHKLKPEAARLLEEALIRGEFDRGEVSRITGLPERTARRLLNDVIATGLLASDTPKGAVSLRFSIEALEVLFPRLFVESRVRAVSVILKSGPKAFGTSPLEVVPELHRSR